jgi:hypothetical protein
MKMVFFHSPSLASFPLESDRGMYFPYLEPFLVDDVYYGARIGHIININM